MPLFDILDAVLGFDNQAAGQARGSRGSTRSTLIPQRHFENEVGAVDTVANPARSAHLANVFAQLGIDANPRVADTQLTFKDPQALVDLAAQSPTSSSATATRRPAEPITELTPDQMLSPDDILGDTRGATSETSSDDSDARSTNDRTDALLDRMLALLEQRIGR